MPDSKNLISHSNKRNTKIMPKLTNVLLQIALLASGSIGLSAASIFTPLSTQPAQAQTACQCVGFVQRYFGIYIPVWAAKDAVGALPRMGYRQVGVRNGAIAVFQPSHGSVDRTYGHIGVVVGSSNGYVTIRSANQWSNRLFSQAGCSNVSDVSFRINNGVTFWGK
jgi:CHAP domain